VAATLLQIKARYLLPDLGGEEDVEEEEIDELLTARELLEKLIEYRSFKEIVSELKHLEEQSSGVFYRYKMPEFFDPSEGREVVRGNLELLFEAMAGVLRFIEKRGPHTTLFEEYKVEDKIEYLQARLNETGEMDVIQEFERCLNKIEVIVTFLALLELVRLKRARVAQPGPEREIRIFSIREEPNGGEQPAPPQDSGHHEQENQQAEASATQASAEEESAPKADFPGGAATGSDGTAGDGESSGSAGTAGDSETAGDNGTASDSGTAGGDESTGGSGTGQGAEAGEETPGTAA